MVGKMFTSGGWGDGGIVATGTEGGPARDHCSRLCFDMQTHIEMVFSSHVTNIVTNSTACCLVNILPQSCLENIPQIITFWRHKRGRKCPDVSRRLALASVDNTDSNSGLWLGRFGSDCHDVTTPVLLPTCQSALMLTSYDRSCRDVSMVHVTHTNLNLNYFFRCKDSQFVANQLPKGFPASLPPYEKHLQGKSWSTLTFNTTALVKNYFEAWHCVRDTAPSLSTLLSKSCYSTKSSLKAP